MSDEEPPHKIRQKMERIFLCNDIWFDCLPFLSRPKVGLAFALVSDRFDGLADAHLGSKKRPWTLGKLWIEPGQNNAIIVKKCWTETEKHLPLPDGPLPDNVIGFECISIFYIDHKVIDFLRRIRRLFQPKKNGDDGIGLGLAIRSSKAERSWAVFFDSIWPLIDSSAITKLYFRYNSLDFFRQHISPTFLLDLANVRVIDVIDIWLGDGPNAQLLWQWLHSPREDGKPKLLKNYYDKSLEMVDELKKTFLSDETAVSFIISMQCYDRPLPFELDNLRTGERLAFRKVGKYYWLLERGPIGGRNVEQWAKWEREVTEWEPRELEKRHNLRTGERLTFRKVQCVKDINWLLERGPIGGKNVEQWAKWEEEVMGEEKKHNVLTLLHSDALIGPLDETAGPSGQQLQQK